MNKAECACDPGYYCNAGRYTRLLVAFLLSCSVLDNTDNIASFYSLETNIGSKMCMISSQIPQCGPSGQCGPGGANLPGGLLLHGWNVGQDNVHRCTGILLRARVVDARRNHMPCRFVRPTIMFVSILAIGSVLEVTLCVHCRCLCCTSVLVLDYQ